MELCCVIRDFLTAHLRQLRRGQDGLINREADLIVVDEGTTWMIRCEVQQRSASVREGFLVLSEAQPMKLSPLTGKIFSKRPRQHRRRSTHSFDCLKVQMQQQINTAQQDMRYAEHFFFDGSEESLALLEAMIEAVKSVALSIQVYSSFEYNNRSTAASDELDELSETLCGNDCRSG